MIVIITYELIIVMVNIQNVTAFVVKIYKTCQNLGVS